MTSSIRHALHTLCAIVIASPLAAQGNGQSTPLEVAETVFAALDSKDWTSLLKVVHPAAARQFYNDQLVLASFEEDLAKREIWKIQGRSVMYDVYGASSVAEMRSLGPNTVLTRWLAVRFGGDELSRETRTALGVVTEGDSLAHVPFSKTPVACERRSRSACRSADIEDRARWLAHDAQWRNRLRWEWSYSRLWQDRRTLASLIDCGCTRRIPVRAAADPAT
jgi:hypothetical protein